MLARAGADLLAVETIPSAREARVLRRLLERLDTAPPAWFSFTCRDGANLSDGTPVEEIASDLADCFRIGWVGVNCTAPQYLASLIPKFRAASGKPVVAYPNGDGRWDPGRKIWETPAETANLPQLAPEWRRLGATLIGGCCRTRPDDIRAIRAAPAERAASDANKAAANLYGRTRSEPRFTRGGSMTIKRDPSGRRFIEVEVEVPATPEEVWEALATGPGISSWLYPTDVEEREGGVLCYHTGSKMDSPATVSVWIRRIGLSRRQRLRPGRPPTTTRDHRASAGWTVSRARSAQPGRRPRRLGRPAQELRSRLAAGSGHHAALPRPLPGQRTSIVRVIGATDGSAQDAWQAAGRRTQRRRALPG